MDPFTCVSGRIGSCFSILPAPPLSWRLGFLQSKLLIAPEPAGDVHRILESEFEQSIHIRIGNEFRGGKERLPFAAEVFLGHTPVGLFEF
jgi:hypothetical protein